MWSVVIVPNSFCHLVETEADWPVQRFLAQDGCGCRAAKKKKKEQMAAAIRDPRQHLPAGGPTAAPGDATWITQGGMQTYDGTSARPGNTSSLALHGAPFTSSFQQFQLFDHPCVHFPYPVPLCRCCQWAPATFALVRKVVSFGNLERVAHLRRKDTKNKNRQDFCSDIYESIAHHFSANSRSRSRVNIFKSSSDES